MAWIDVAYTGRMIGTTQSTKLGFDDAATFAQLELAARSTVVAVMQHAGYAAPADTVSLTTVTGAFLAKLCAAVMVRDAYGDAKGIVLPAKVQDGLTLLDAVYNRKLPIPGSQPDTLDGYGGIKGSSVATGTTDPRPAVFARSRMTGF